MPNARAEDVVLLVSPDDTRYIVHLQPGKKMHTHCGILSHDDVIGAAYGTQVPSHTDQPFGVVRPSLEEVLRTIKRASQIVFPKDIGYILLKLSVVPGARVVEAGTGSGALTVALARYVTPGGHVYTYERREDMRTVARGNLEQVGLIDSVTMHPRAIGDGFDETDVDAVFLDVREPWHYLEQVNAALGGGAFFGSIVPTTNQVSELVAGLEQHSFVDLEVCELMLRQYKTVAQRLRPMDRLTAHTGYLVFARKATG